MKVVLISGHDGESDRKTGFHFWADILARRGDEAYFLTVGASPISLLKKNKQLKKPFNKWVSLGQRKQKFTWMPPFHPLYLGRDILHTITKPIFALYPYLIPPNLMKVLKQADLFIIENGAGQLLVPRLARLNPFARFIFNSSDRPSVVKFHPLVVESERKMLPYLDAIRLNAAAMASDFPPGTETHYIPQAIDKSLFDAPLQNPYDKPKNAINVGDMIFDAKAIEVMARNFPDWTFHLFGKGARITQPMQNVVEHGEVPFADLTPYLKHADIGLSPYINTEKAAYLAQSSLKNVQYTYCQLPIVAPAIAAGSRPHILPYTSSDDEQSMVNAFRQAIDYDRATIDKNVIPSWEDVLDRMIALANAHTRPKKQKAVFLLTHRPGVMCGVGDYTVRLVDALKASGLDAVVEFLDAWSLKNILAVRKKYKDDKNVVFHLQYPSLGMGNSLLPGLLPLLLAPCPVYVTLHEFSVFNVLRKSIFLPIAKTAKRILFTNEFEKEQFRQYFPLTAGKLGIIPIGENILVASVPNLPPKIRERVIYFGQISAKKGLELYLDTIHALRQQNIPVDAAIIGSILDEQSDITRAMRRAAAEDNIELHLNYPSEKVSEELQKSSVALLAFPDGISEKRGSALACMLHGNFLITTHSGKTPEWLRKSTVHITTAKEAADMIAAIVRGQRPETDRDAMTKPMQAREWPNIADSHISTYQRHAKA